ncbi:MAG TPA: VOC family protein, partial [Burkholderiales bacterium]|nr:VOC family protein [Burkholderiales bacterium]
MTIAERQKPAAGELYLDHVAHFVPDLDAAGRLAEALGFSVTPVSAHRDQNGPAGTSNRCLMFEQGYVEILAPTLDTPNARRVRERMKSFVGVHLACFGTPDAEAEHRRLAAHGFEPEPLVRLERNVDARTTVRFNVVHLPPAKMPEGRMQYVQQLTPEHLWQPRHVNPFRLTGVYVVAEDPVQT